MYNFTVKLRRILAVNFVCLIVWILIVDISSVTGYNGTVCTAFCSGSGEDGYWFDADYCTGREFCCGRKDIFDDTKMIKYCCVREVDRIDEIDNQPAPSNAKSECGKTNLTKIIVPAVVAGVILICVIVGCMCWFKKRQQMFNQVNGPASSTVVYGGAAAHNAYSGPQNNAPYPNNPYGGPQNNAPYPPAGAPPPPANYYGAPPPSYDSKY
ncbi:uncharacterized protein LOC141907638 [Tubulanus polymorphus]|uniref:uncharacterized protein LOC141907638 n=1 Tax=Tubulanus polymorphus TaxID=672921 RepID=UPI003DA21CEE